MPKQERERRGPFVVTTVDNLHSDGEIVCAMCNRRLSTFNAAQDNHTPPPEQLLRDGAVPVPNFGWFCSQECGSTYETKYGLRFQRGANGAISYYG